jgi:ABC-type bacteriocin/lantibiotic exporter with double-glycine peptidase domain
MKNYNLIPQEKDNYCVCSVLQAVFDFHGKRLNQKDISKKLTSSEKGFKINDDQIKIFLTEMGFDYIFYWRNETPLNEPWLVLDDMKKDHGLVGINQHIYLFYDFNYPKLNLIDPLDGEIKLKDYNKMIKEMYKTEGFFGLIRKI